MDSVDSFVDHALLMSEVVGSASVVVDNAKSGDGSSEKYRESSLVFNWQKIIEELRSYFRITFATSKKVRLLLFCFSFAWLINQFLSLGTFRLSSFRAQSY